MTPIKFLPAVLAFGASPAMAHPGHLAETAGHDHVGALVALGAIAVILIAGTALHVANRRLTRKA